MGQCRSVPSTVGDVEEGGRREGDEATWSSLKNKCFTIAMEQRSRFYIVRRKIGEREIPYGKHSEIYECEFEILVRFNQRTFTLKDRVLLFD
ncbi:hypothetical protein V6N13_132282 [Hibiscus sabdariffa]|uniref:Uncharacterized protein n=1 Tax=Hibiscus sabdariffa TaxID=183260 RepID=A0ABR2PUS5_9ROSI